MFSYNRKTGFNISAGGEIGKLAILRWWCRKAWRFESSPAHQKGNRKQEEP